MTTEHEHAQGRRARKRRARANAIELAAVRLALEIGHGAVTVEAVCEAVDISRSTFFNYFPTLATAILGPGIDLPEPDLALAEFDALAAHQPVPVAVLQYGLALLGTTEVHGEVGRLRRRLVAGDPELHTLYTARIAAVEADLAELVARWLALHPERRIDPAIDAKDEAAAAVGVASAATGVLITRYFAADDDRPVLGTDLRDALRVVAAAAQSALAPGE